MIRTLVGLMLICVFLLPACSDDDAGAGGSGQYTLFFESGLLLPGAYDGVVLSDAEGEVVLALPWGEVGDRIELPEPQDARFSLTFLRTFNLDAGGQLDTVFQHRTYANLQSGSTLRNVPLFLKSIETVVLTLSGVQSVEEVVVRSINNQNLGWTLQGEELEIVLNRFAGEALTVYTKANGESDYRYFYTESAGENFMAEFSDLESGLERQTISLPGKDFWVGNITAIDASGKRLEVFGFRNTAGEDQFDSLECWWPTSFQPAAFELELEGLINTGTRILERVEVLPQAWAAPGWSSAVDALSPGEIRFTPDPEVAFWESTYRFSTDPGNPFVNTSFWQVLGAAQEEVDFTFPVFSASEASLFPIWGKYTGPANAEIVQWSSATPISEEERLQPSLYLTKDRQMEWKLLGLEEFKSF